MHVWNGNVFRFMLSYTTWNIVSENSELTAIWQNNETKENRKNKIQNVSSIPIAGKIFFLPLYHKNKWDSS